MSHSILPITIILSGLIHISLCHSEECAVSPIYGLKEYLHQGLNGGDGDENGRWSDIFFFSILLWFHRSSYQGPFK